MAARATGSAGGRGRLGVAVTLLLVTALLVADWRFAWLRFTHPRANAIAMIVACLLPAAALALAGRRVPERWRPPVIGLGGLVAASGIAVAIWIGVTRAGALAHDRDPRLVPIARAVVFGHRLVGYRVATRAGGTGVVVREEIPVLPGVVRVRRVGSLADATAVEIDPLGGRMVRLSYPPVPGRRDAVVDRIVRLPGARK